MGLKYPQQPLTANQLCDDVHLNLIDNNYILLSLYISLQHSTVKFILKRGETLDDLMEKSAAVSKSGELFYKTVSILSSSQSIVSTFLPHKVKMQYLHFRSHAEYFLLSWKIPEVMSRRPILFNN